MGRGVQLLDDLDWIPDGGPEPVTPPNDPAAEGAEATLDAFTIERIAPEPEAAASAPAAPRVGVRPRRILKRAAVIVGGAILGGIALAVLGVAAYRVVQPPFTITMAIRAAQGHDVRREVVPLEEISPSLVKAVIAAEDGRFCSHGGFDPAAIRAALAEARAGGRVRGASTISQQTAKNAFLWTGGGWPRKGAEAVLTVMIETVWPKRRIMEVYLNEAEWGDGLFGAEAAAQARFGKSAADLTPREAALMAAVLPNPNAWRLDPPGDYVSHRATTLEARMRDVDRDGLARCVFE
jgi:monofunctional biosynthetic peptidoglycan transglycosylase